VRNRLDARYRVMKKLPVLLCIFLLSACAPSEVPSDKILERNGIKYEINSQIPFTGVLTEYHENGQLSYKSNHKDGEKHGLSERYYENGQLSYKINYKGGEKHGFYEIYYENSQLWMKFTNNDGEPDGLFRRYHENGQLEYKGNHKDGEEHGLFRRYHENGQEENYSPVCYQNGNQVDMSKCK